MHVAAPEGTPMANAFVTLLNGIGHDDLPSFGDSTHKLPLTMTQRSTAVSGVGQG
jgi:hypothetical protein